MIPIKLIADDFEFNAKILLITSQSWDWKL